MARSPRPPDEWFQDPGLTGPTRLTVTGAGRVVGHIATWETPHTGYRGRSRPVYPPRSTTGYAYFHTGAVRAASGAFVRTGPLTLADHPGPGSTLLGAATHYDRTGVTVADVHAGEDRWGIYITGALRPGVTAAQVHRIRALHPSGDWRVCHRRLHELVGICQVDTPGFPVTAAGGAAPGPLSEAARAAARVELDAIARRLEGLEDRRRWQRVLAAGERVDALLEERAVERWRGVEERWRELEQTRLGA